MFIVNPSAMRQRFNTAHLQTLLTRAVRQTQPRLQQPNEIKQHQQQQQSAADVAYDKCEYYFQKEFLVTINKFAHNLDKRQLIPFLGGVAFSNIITSVEEKFLGHEDESERVAIINKQLKNLNENFNIMKMLADIQSSQIREVQTWANHFTDKMHQFMAHQPELTIVASYIISKITNKATLLNRLYISLEQNRPDLVTLGKLLHTGKFGRLHPASVKLNQITSVSPSQLKIIMSGEIASANTSIYIAHPFEYATQSLKSFTKHEYVGKTWIVFNSTASCAKAVEPTVRTFVKESCEQVGYTDPRLKLWRKTSITNLLEIPTQYFDTYPTKRLYCAGRNITYSVGKETMTKQCPLYPFEVSQNISFKTSDDVVAHTFKNIQTLDKMLDIKVNVAEIHFDRPFDDNSELWRNHQNLLEKSNNLSGQFVLMEIGNTTITYWHTTIGLIWVLCLIVLGVTLRSAYLNCVQPIKSKRFRTRVISLKDDDIYDVALKRMRTRSKK